MIAADDRAFLYQYEVVSELLLNRRATRRNNDEALRCNVRRDVIEFKVFSFVDLRSRTPRLPLRWALFSAARARDGRSLSAFISCFSCTSSTPST